jgi:DNA-binding response OmpR family regulator
MPKILVVEDGTFMVAVYRSRLAKAGFEIDTALDGKEAIEKLEKYIPDLVLLDLILPIEDGYSVLERMKKDEKLKNVPVMIVTNLSKSEAYDRTMELGADDYLVKSEMTQDDLADKINALLKKKK